MESFSENQFISSDGQYFRIISSQKSHSGSYICMAENELGSVEKKFDVEVHGEKLVHNADLQLIVLILRIFPLVSMGILERM